jgi:DNA polymerase-3 subunit delta'
MTSLAPGWRSIVGHEWAIHLLSNAIAHHRVGHAYLLTGPDHIGKMTLARAFAQALNCTAEPAQRPCGMCRACRLIAGDKHPDVRVILPEISERGAQSIKIEQIRGLQQDLSLSAYEARYKVALLKRFDTANLNAANAFLKTLEEPPANVILVLTATDSDSVLPTVNSRCRTVGLRPISTALIEETLMTRHRVGVDEANLLAHLADGRLGWAIGAHEDPAILQERRTELEALDQALRGSLVARFAQAEALARKPDKLPSLLQTWLSWWRDLALLAYGQPAGHAITNIDRGEQLHDMAATWSRGAVLPALAQTAAALRQLRQNGNARLVLENVMLAYPRPL